VSLSPSTTRPFDAPELVLTLRYRHPARGHRFAGVSYTVSTLQFGPFRRLYDSPIPCCHIGLTPARTADSELVMAYNGRNTLEDKHGEKQMRSSAQKLF
jgi:hypothetical protein